MMKSVSRFPGRTMFNFIGVSAGPKTRAFVFALALALHSAFAISQSQPAPSVLVKAGRLLDVRKDGYIEGGAIWWKS
jgi:hypothetical protein